MTSPGATTAAAPDTGAGPTVQLPVVDVRMQEFALPPVPDLGELTGIHIPPPPTPEEFFAGLPPLPALDLSALVSPLLSQMQLLGEGIIPGPWGTGGDADHAGAGGGLSGLFNLSEVLSESLSTGSSAMNALQGQWQGEGSESAKVTGEQIEADKNAVKTQGEQIAATVRVGAGIINHGNMLLKAVAARLATTLAALSPTAVTPGGQAAIVSAVAAATAEAEAIIATTEAELVPPTQTMLALAEPVPVRMPPGAEVAQLQKATQMARQVMEPVQQVMQQMGAGDPRRPQGRDSPRATSRTRRSCRPGTRTPPAPTRVRLSWTSCSPTTSPRRGPTRAPRSPGWAVPPRSGRRPCSAPRAPWARPGR